MAASHLVESYKVSINSDREDISLYDGNGAYVAKLRFYDSMILPNNSVSTVASTEACHSSPLGIVIHPEYGLWHAYRGALVFAERFDLPVAEQFAHPCVTCESKPCLTACPVDAFVSDLYDVAACASHIDTAAGEDCMNLDCRARRACPVGPGFRYQPGQAHLHMTAFLRACQSS